MAPNIKPFIELTENQVKKAAETADSQITKLEQIKKEYLEKAHQQIALEYAKSLGMQPINTLEKLRIMLNEKIITEVRKRKLKNTDVAAIAQINKSRVSAILNRRLERVSIDTMVCILNRLGISPGIHW